MQKIKLKVIRGGKIVNRIISNKSVIGSCIDLAAALDECVAGDKIVAYEPISDEFLGLLLMTSDIEIRK